VSTTNKIFLVGAAEAFPEGFAKKIAKEKGLQLCAFEFDSLKAMAAIQRLQPSVAVINVSNADQGLTLVRLLRAANAELKILLHSELGDPEFVAQALDAGAQGYYLRRDSAPDELLLAIRDTLGGRIYISEEILNATVGKTAQQLRRKPGRGARRMP